MAKKPAIRRPSEISGLHVEASGDRPVIYLYGEIGPEAFGLIDDMSFIRALGDITADELDVRINSPGGSVFHAVAIYNALLRHHAEVHVHVDAVAASAASVIAMVGHSITIAANARFMIHNAMTIAVGNSEDLGKTIELLNDVDATMVKTYATRTSQTEVQVREWMKAETWFNAEQAVKHGFADSMGSASDVTACVPAGRFKNAPKDIERRTKAKSIVQMLDPPERPAGAGGTPAQPNPGQALAANLNRRIAALRASILS